MAWTFFRSTTGSQQLSLGRHYIDIDNFGAEFASLDAAGGVDLVDADVTPLSQSL